jgi:hypothetical protein
MSDGKLKHGYDAGAIIDGVVKLDEKSGSYVINDCDGEVFNVNEALENLVGKRIRLTMISFDALKNMQEMYENSIKD